MRHLSLLQLGSSIRDVFINSDDYMMDKYVPEFQMDGTYFADTFNTTIVERPQGGDPIFYHTYSPYDIVSNKAPNQALVFQGGRLLLNDDFASYIPLRTGVMSSLVLSNLGKTQLTGKLLLVGTGRIAQNSLLALRGHFPRFSDFDFINQSGSDERIMTFAAEHSFTAKRGSMERIGEYDYIICHSSAKKPVLTAAMRTHIKQGAFIASFVSENFRELDPEYYNTAEANVLTDYEPTIGEASDLGEAVERGIADKNHITFLKDLFSGAAVTDSSKHYTVYRSHGSPMQDLAVLKLLLADV